MPVARRKAIYGENPEQSQYSSAGLIRLNPASINPGILPGAGPFKIILPTSVAPPLGYVWSIVNFHIPVGVVITGGENPEIELTMNINVGSQNLFAFRQTAKPATHKTVPTGVVENFLFSETPAQDLTIPSGQELNLEFILNITSITNAVQSIEMAEGSRFSFTPSAEGFSYFVKPAESSINYRFV